jgi:hypothetical protein
VVRQAGRSGSGLRSPFSCVWWDRLQPVNIPWRCSGRTSATPCAPPCAAPGFAAVTAISLALGIGANTAIFSILDAVLFRELAAPQPRQLVELAPIYRNGAKVPFSFPMFQALDRWQRVFSGLYGWTGAAHSNVEGGGTLFLGGVRAVTGNYYSGLGATPLLGRLIAPGDLTGNPHVAVLGYGCWEGRFGRDPAVVGKTLRIEGKPFTIVGVTRQWFAGMTPGEPPDVTIPIAAAPFDRESRALLTTFATGRLRGGVTIEQARSQLASFWPELCCLPPSLPRAAGRAGSRFSPCGSPSSRPRPGPIAGSVPASRGPSIC